MSESRQHGLACLVIALVVLATWWPRMGGPIDLRWDGAAYYMLGTSLAAGEGYGLTSEPGGIQSSLHPPFLPVLVAAHQLVLQSSDPVLVGRALRVSMLAFSLAYAVAIYFLLAAHLRRRYALAAALIGVLQPQFIYVSDGLYAETWFGLVTVVFFLLQRQRTRAGRAWAAACAVLAYAARTAGIALLAAWVAESLIRRDWRRAAVALAISVVPIVAWIGWIKWVEASPAYREPAYAYQTAPWVYFNVSYARNMLELNDPFSPELGPLTLRGFSERVSSNVQVLPHSIGQALSTWGAPGYVSVPLAALAMLGMLLLARRGEYLMLLYVALSLAALSVTPFPKQFGRYLVPLYPFLALALFLAVQAMTRRAGSAPAWIVVGVIAAAQARDLRKIYGPNHHQAAYEQGGQRVSYPLFHYAPVGAAYDEALDWLNRQVQASDVIATTDPQWVHLRTGRKAVLPPFEIDGKKAQQLIDTVPATYLIAETMPEHMGLGAYHRYTAALLRENPSAWAHVWRSTNERIDVYRRTGLAR